MKLMKTVQRNFLLIAIVVFLLTQWCAPPSSKEIWMTMVFLSEIMLAIGISILNFEHIEWDTIGFRLWLRIPALWDNPIVHCYIQPTRISSCLGWKDGFQITFTRKHGWQTTLFADQKPPSNVQRWLGRIVY